MDDTVVGIILHDCQHILAYRYIFANRTGLYKRFVWDNIVPMAV